MFLSLVSLPMPQPHRQSLGKLIQQCTQPSPPAAPSDSTACRELLRRAVCAHNDRAWDAIAPHLRAFLLRRIYEQRPELSPQLAERLIYQALADFLAQLHRQPDLTRHFPAYSALLTMLEQSLARLLKV